MGDALTAAVEKLGERRIEQTHREVRELSTRIKTFCDRLDEMNDNQGRMNRMVAYRIAQMFVSRLVPMHELDGVVEALRALHRNGKCRSAGGYFYRSIQNRAATYGQTIPRSKPKEFVA